MFKKVIDKIEKVTGLDIDGDGTIGGESYATPAIPPNNLPPGWEMRWEPNAQRYYYVNHVEKVTQWEPPRNWNVKPNATGQSPFQPSAAQTGRYGYCTECGKEHLTEGIRFCNHCGTPVRPAVSAPSAPSAPVQPTVPVAAAPSANQVPVDHR